jgi:serine/threonine protein kinase
VWVGALQVCDFNLSRVMEESAILSSMAASNPRWLAPEILSGRGYTFSSDVYSFGVIMWEFLTWQIPWHECGPWQVCTHTILHVTTATQLHLQVSSLADWFLGRQRVILPEWTA